MFPKTRNLETAFQHVRSFTILVVAGSLLLCGFVIWQALRAIDRNQDRIYILESGRALEAMAGSRRENIPVEARDHIRTFHEDFFTLDPDEKLIAAHLGKALYLADGSARRVYEGLKESGYYNGIIAGNISQEICIDSIALEMHQYPIAFRCYATERIIRPTSLVTRNLVTEGWLRNTGRSDNDPHGFLIERWTILDNHDLKVETR
ncbi:MAG TPA: conjugative transposon protein TraK [Puia sp.]|nr:conjugative transposon protein TraK [Puia sp.]